MPLRTAAVPIRRASSSPLGFNKGISGVPALKLTKSAHGRLATARVAAPSSIVKTLPLELIVRLFAFCDAPSTFATVCRTFASIAQDPYARAKWFIARYGPRMAFYQAFKAHRRAFNPEVARCMLLQSAVLPRFVIQYVVREYHQRRSSFGVLGGGNMGLQGGVSQGGVGLGGQGQGQGGGVQAAATPSLITTGSTINVYGESLATRNKGYVSAALYAFFVAQGYNLYESDADFKEDDAMRFERLLYGTSSGAHSPSLDAIRDLIVRFKFVPVKGTGSSLDEIVYTVSKLDLSLVDQLFANGLQRTDELNDLVVERVLWRTDITEDLLRAYVNHGFKLTGSAVKKGLQMSRPATVEALRAHVPHETLQKLAEETVVDMLGPNTRGWSFTPEAIDYLRQSFIISEDVIERALYVRPPSVYAAKAAATQANGSQLPDVHEFPATRCYFKPNPCSVWRWVLRAYGPDHPFTLACFDDALSRAAGDRDLHALHDIFLDAGVKFRPRHVKILACRVLHRDMASNALHLIKVLRPQLADRFRTVSPTIKDPASPSTPLRYFQYLSDADDTLDPSEWIKALKDEVVENREWVERMRTTQLEGGPRGGVYRVTRPPEEGLKFLEEAREIVGELMGVGGGVGTPSILEWNGRAMRRCLGNGEGSSGDGGSSQAAAAEHEGHNSATTVPTMDEGVEDVGSHEDTEVSAGSTSRVEEVRMPSLGCSPDPTEEVSADPEPTAAEEQPAACVEPEPVVHEPASPLVRSLTQQEDASSVRSRSRHLKGDGASWFGMALGRILRNRFHPKSYTRT